MAFFEFPHTRTYDSDLAWLIHAYKLLKAQTDDIQESIQQIVDEALNDPTYVARVLAVLAPLNVKYPPSDAGLDAAKGDGVTDDTDAITGMIAYAYEHGMPLLFPAGQYVVSGLTVSNDMTFIGLGGTLFLKAGAVNPLITVKGGYLTATGLEFNGNIAGQTEPKNVFVVDGGGFKLDNCVITGGVDGIHANINAPSFITGVDIDNFTEYGVYVKGSSFINAHGVTMNVASGGALRLMRVDASNCVFNGIESLAEVAIAFEVTGDFNYFLARVPNAETPTSDSGQNNNFEIIAHLSKRTYQNLMEKVDRDYTQEVGDFDGTATGHYAFSAPDIELNPENPLTYKDAAVLNDYYKSVPFKTKEGETYNVLVFNDEGKYINVKLYGAKGDGITDDTAAIKAAFNSNNAVYFPAGTYVIREKLSLENASFKGDGAQESFLYWPSDAVSGGIENTLTKVEKYLAACCNIENISIVTNMAPSKKATAISIDGTAILESRTVQSLYMNNVVIGLYQGSFTNSGWNICLDLLNLVNSIVSNTTLMGSINGAEPSYSSERGIYFHGDGSEPHSGGLTLSNVYASYFQTALQIERIEGIICDKIQFVGVNTGVLLNGPERYPHFSMFNSHINASGVCINALHAKQIFVVGCLLYLQLSTTPGTVANFGEDTDSVFIISNQFATLNGLANYGMSFMGSRNYVFQNQMIEESGTISPAFNLTNTSENSYCLYNLGNVINNGTDNIIDVIAGGIETVNADPEYPREGQMWFNTTDKQLKIRAAGYTRYITFT